MASSNPLPSKVMESLMCSLCLDVFEEATLLRCGHSFCRKCLERCDECHQTSLSMLCPLCRQQTELGAEGVAGLPSNVSLNHLVEAVTNVTIMAEVGGSRVPDFNQQKQQISELLDTQLKKGDSWYLIDTKWFKQWKKYVGYDRWDMYNMDNEAANPGPVNNSGLFVEGQVGSLKDHLINEKDYVLVPTVAWNRVTTWYGVTADQPPIERKVVDYGMFVEHFKVEVYPMELKLCEHSDLKKIIPRKFSKDDTIAMIENEMRKLFNIESKKETRMWNKYMSYTYEQLSQKGNTVQYAGLYQGQVLVIEQKNKDGTWPRLWASHGSG